MADSLGKWPLSAAQGIGFWPLRIGAQVSDERSSGRQGDLEMKTLLQGGVHDCGVCNGSCFTTPDPSGARGPVGSGRQREKELDCTCLAGPTCTPKDLLKMTRYLIGRLTLFKCLRERERTRRIRLELAAHQSCCRPAPENETIDTDVAG
jgi:hypothetical protein